MKFTKYIISFAFLAIGIASFTSCDKISGIFDRSTPTEETTETTTEETTEEVTEEISEETTEETTIEEVTESETVAE